MIASENSTTQYLNFPYTCNGFEIREHVKYKKDGEIRDGYILCFRQFGYNWFAWICPDKNSSLTDGSFYVGDLIKIEK